MIARRLLLDQITVALRRSRVVLLTGPRQCGKTTLARKLLSEDSVNYFDLEDPASLARLDEPMTALRPLTGLVVIDTEKALLSHPKLGASWEGFVIEQVLTTTPHDEAYFWATHQGAEIDLILRHGDRLFGIECKRSDAPKMTPSLRIATEDLGLERIAVVYPGERRYPLSDTVEAVPLATLATGGGLCEEAGGSPPEQ